MQNIFFSIHVIDLFNIPWKIHTEDLKKPTDLNFRKSFQCGFPRDVFSIDLDPIQFSIIGRPTCAKRPLRMWYLSSRIVLPPAISADANVIVSMAGDRPNFQVLKVLEGKKSEKIDRYLYLYIYTVHVIIYIYPSSNILIQSPFKSYRTLMESLLSGSLPTGFSHAFKRFSHLNQPSLLHNSRRGRASLQVVTNVDLSTCQIGWMFFLLRKTSFVRSNFRFPCRPGVFFVLFVYDSSLVACWNAHLGSLGVCFLYILLEPSWA